MATRSFPALLGAAVVALCLTALFWWLPNRPVMIDGAGTPKVLKSVSFAPFRRGQSPLDRVYPSAAEIEADLASLKGTTRGVRTYTSLEGMHVVPEAARRLNMEVVHSAWLGVEKPINEKEVAALIDQANRYPDVIKRVIVGNEVLLRRDLTAAELAAYIRRVRGAVKQPVSYADVWEFWLKNPELANEVDYITVHFLPYWEDEPVAADLTQEHIMKVYRTVQAAFPGKPILIGEVGWPALGRDRRSAIPSRVEAVRFLSGFVSLAEREGLDYNIVEAFDQVWKTKLEGTVGGAWGILDVDRTPKFPIGGAIVEKPHWMTLLLASVAAGLILLIAAGSLPFPGTILIAQAFGAMLVFNADAAWALHLNSGQFLPGLPHLILQTMLAVILLRALARSLDGKASATAPMGAGAILDACARVLRGGDARHSLPALARRHGGELLLLLFVVAMLYQLFMLTTAGRYRDFPIGDLLVPALGPVLIALVKRFSGVGGFWDSVRFDRLMGRGTAPTTTSRSAFAEGLIAYLLIGLGIILVLTELPSNREADALAVLAAAMALPYLAVARARS